MIQHIKAGKLRAVSVTAARRASAFPDLPAIAESPGLRDYDPEFAAYVGREMVKYEQLVKTLNVKAE